MVVVGGMVLVSGLKILSLSSISISFSLDSGSISKLGGELGGRVPVLVLRSLFLPFSIYIRSIEVLLIV